MIKQRTILGIDPGTNILGFGIISVNGSGKPQFLDMASDASGDNGFFKDATIDWLIWASKHNLSWCNWSFADKGESASALQKDASAKNWNSVTESGNLIRCVLRDPSMKSVNNYKNDNKKKK